MLKVEFFVQGSVEMSENRLSINGNILRTDDNLKIWSKSFRGAINDVFILRENFIEEIIQVLQIPIPQPAKQRFMQRLTLDTQAYDFYLRGQDYFQRHFETDYEIAAQMYRKALKIDSNYALAYAGLGRVFLRQYLWYMDRDITLVDSAEIFIKKALSIDPYLADVHLALGDLYREMGTKKIDDAIKEYEEAIRLNPTFIDAMRSLSRNLWLWGRFEESKKISKRILQLRPVHITSYIDLGFANWLQGFIDVAGECFDTAIELEPDLPLVYGQKGYFCFLNGRFSEAKTVYEKLSKLDPKSSVAVSAIGQIYFFQKDTSNAIDYLRKSLKIKSGGMDYFRLGLIHEMKGEAAIAIAYYDKAQIILGQYLKKSPEDHLFLTELAIIYAAKEDDFKALDYMRKAKMTCDFQTNILRRNRVLLREAVMYSLLGMNDSALESLEKVIDSRVYAPECLKHYLGLEKIRLDPRFEKLLSNRG
jgi:tetratricopeptide (TPR) repeat protein